MGLIDFVRKGIGEGMVARADAQKHLIVYKHPNGNIPNFSQLTVDFDEWAVFFRSGSPPSVGALGPGRYQLSTQNIPFLNSFITGFTGGNIFQAEVFFVKSQPVRNLTFGGTLGSMMDPLLAYPVTPRVYGSYSMVVVDPVRFIIGYTGQAAQGDNDAITEWIRKRLFLGISRVVADVVSAPGATFLSIGGKERDLADAIVRSCPDLADIGVRVLEVAELSVNLSEEDQAELRKLQKQVAAVRAEARAAQEGVATAAARAQARQFELDQNFQNEARYVQQLAGSYQGYAAGKALMGAGEGLAQGGGDAGLVGASAQMMMGLNMASMMQQGMAPRPPGVVGGAPAAAPAAPSAGAVRCASCSAQVPAGKFCQECGASLLAPPRRVCASCGTELGAGRFCVNCGTPVPAVPAK